MLYAVDKEITARKDKRVQALLKASKSPNPAACVEEIYYLADRNLSRESIARLARCQWLDETTNLLIIGSSSVGTTYLAQALSNAACRHEYGVLFYRCDDLASQFAVLDDTDPNRRALFEDIIDTDLLILDDFLTTPITAEFSSTLLNILGAREAKGSTLVTSQFEPKQWAESIPDPVIAESIVNRLLRGSQHLVLTGRNMRLNPAGDNTRKDAKE